MQMIRLQRLLNRCALLLTALLGSGSLMASDDQLQSGASYRLVRPVYLMAVYENLDEKRAGKCAATVYLQPEQYARTRWVAFQREVPAGTTIKIIGPAPPAQDLLRSYAAYYVRLAPDPDPAPSSKLDIIVQLFKGFADASGGLSADFFERMN